MARLHSKGLLEEDSIDFHGLKCYAPACQRVGFYNTDSLFGLFWKIFTESNQSAAMSLHSKLWHMTVHFIDSVLDDVIQKVIMQKADH